ncbi:hypothetical protein V1478_008506 [Vespula squamosa]|uniref:Uncharacterized protein n=1 Tax=Vespula squamosa TaxID=30214 RepID=A0ABD2ATP4_VESSQ
MGDPKCESPSMTAMFQLTRLFGTHEIHPLCGTKAMVTIARIFTVNSFVTIESLVRKRKMSNLLNNKYIFYRLEEILHTHMQIIKHYFLFNIFDH